LQEVIFVADDNLGGTVICLHSAT